eukprot:241420-Rhodomonas_salina.1
MEADEAEQQHTSCAAGGAAMAENWSQPENMIESETSESLGKRPRTGREVASTRMGIESERVQAKRLAIFAANEYIATGEGKTGGVQLKDLLVKH